MGDRNRRRDLLHPTHLDRFVAWASQRGYVREPTKGASEVLRLRREGEAPILFYQRFDTDHVTTFGNGTALAVQFVRMLNGPRTPEGAQGDGT